MPRRRLIKARGEGHSRSRRMARRARAASDIALQHDGGKGGRKGATPQRVGKRRLLRGLWDGAGCGLVVGMVLGWKRGKARCKRAAKRVIFKARVEYLPSWSPKGGTAFGLRDGR